MAGLDFLLGFLACWVWYFASSQVFASFFLFGHPSTFGLSVLLPWVWSVLIRITFKNASDKEDFARMGSLVLDGHDLSVTSSDKPPSLVYVHYFPAEGDDALICDELSKYGEVVGIKHQNFSGIPGLLTGSRILTMFLSDPVPAELRIDDILCGLV